MEELCTLWTQLHTTKTNTETKFSLRFFRTDRICLTVTYYYSAISCQIYNFSSPEKIPPKSFTSIVLTFCNTKSNIYQRKPIIIMRKPIYLIVTRENISRVWSYYTNESGILYMNAVNATLVICPLIVAPHYSGISRTLLLSCCRKTFQSFF